MLANMLREQVESYKAGKSSAYFLAETCARSGDKHGALEYLDAAYKQRAEGLGDIESDLAFQDMHADPAFRELVAKIGLPPLP